MVLNDLYDLACDDNIEVDCLKLRNFESISMMIDGDCSIIIDPMQLTSSFDEKVKLAHELGHCETGSFYNIYATCDIREKHEHRATKWQIKKLVPKDELVKAYQSGLSNNYEMAEHFGVTEDFMRIALKYYADSVFNLEYDRSY